MAADRAGAEDRCLHPRSLFPWRAMPIVRLLTLVVAGLLLCKSPAAALDLFATHEVTVQFATSDGKPMADADVQVFAPGDPTHPVKSGKTDKDGKFEFGTDRDGLWTAAARNGTEIAHATIRVGGGGNEQPGDGPSPFLIFGALLVLLVVAVWFRFLRARTRRRRG
jgi:nickel transport protein